MTCFWDGIMRSLDNNDKKLLELENKNSIYSLIESLKKKNKKVENVLWQNSELSNRQKDENKEHIRLYDKNTAKGGYLCSTCDPFLILLCNLLEKDIHHDYLGNKISYKYKNSKKGTYFYKSNRGHFWFSNKN